MARRRADQPCRAAATAQRMLDAYGNRVHRQAIRLTTPVPDLVALTDIRTRQVLRDFLQAYQPEVSEHGLYAHQAALVKALGKAKGPHIVPHIVMTTATGSGKSLGFWAWAFSILARNPNATVVAAFPTQALLWGQAKRLARISRDDRLVTFGDMPGASFAGTIEMGQVKIPWTVWYGTSGCEHMKGHEGSEAFQAARLRLCTLDKVHWSLMREKESGFLARLAGFIIDEAHAWHGLAGANVRRMIDRLRLSLDVMGHPHPAFFLASATLAKAAAFASDLTGTPVKEFLTIDDRDAASASLVKATEVPRLLAEPATPGLLRRYVLLVAPAPAPLSTQGLLTDNGILGADANAICFVQSKFVGHRIRHTLAEELPGHEVVVYDGDLPARERRAVEDALFRADGNPKVVVGTSALELGVDLPTLDVLVMDDLPPRRCELLQRLGRVGRTAERPGLAILCLGYSAIDERLLTEPLAALAIDDLEPLALPLHLDIVKLQSMRAVFAEWMARLKANEASWDDFNTALERYYNWAPHYRELKARIEELLGDVVDLDDGAWWYKGFRASASQGKIPLVSDDGTVANIDNMAVFRDAHPEGVYLGHRGLSYRVTGYRGDWQVATWQSPEGVVLGKFMKGLQAIEVTPEEPYLATRGRWRDCFTLQEQTEPSAGCGLPSRGVLTFGIFLFLRKFDGYQQIDFRTGQVRLVSLQDVARRFNAALQVGRNTPFLHDFSYRTLGWVWLISRVLDKATRVAGAQVLAPLIESFLADAAECSNRDIQVTLDSHSAELRVVDTSPGGSGLSDALLHGGRVARALHAAAKAVRGQGKKGPDAFRRYLAELSGATCQLSAEEIADAIDRLANAWQG